MNDPTLTELQLRDILKEVLGEVLQKLASQNKIIELVDNNVAGAMVAQNRKTDQIVTMFLQLQERVESLENRK